MCVHPPAPAPAPQTCPASALRAGLCADAARVVPVLSGEPASSTHFQLLKGSDVPSGDASPPICLVALLSVSHQGRDRHGEAESLSPCVRISQRSCGSSYNMKRCVWIHGLEHVVSA